MQTATQLDLFTYSPPPEGAAAPLAGTDTRPWLTFATLWQLLKPGTCRVVIFHQHGDDATVAIAARTLGTPRLASSTTSHHISKECSPIKIRSRAVAAKATGSSLPTTSGCF